jgi:G:T-mismatch repair DNA endonuclease (very short patch repair protein)
MVRHENVARELEELGWRVLLVWECGIVDLDMLARRLGDALAGG